jgi:type IV secretory pathway VirB6-like protein
VRKFSIKYIVKIILIAVFLTPLIFQQEIYANKDGGVERIRECKAGIFPPFDTFNGENGSGLNKEMDFDISNPACLGEALTAYVAVRTGLTHMFCQCLAKCTPRITFSPIKDVADLSKSSYRAFNNPRGACGIAYGSSLAGMATIILGYLGGVYEVAKDHYNNVRVCGSDWFNSNDAKKKNVFTNKHTIKPSGGMTDSKDYREWIYGGKEVEDNPNSGEQCIDPATKSPQRYYFRGLLPANFLCEKYNPLYNGSDVDQYKKAYKCCLERSQNYICLEKREINVVSVNSHEYVLCKGNSKCTFKNNIAVVFEAYKRDNDRVICAKSHSLCPYNFSVGGGTVYQEHYLDGKYKDDVFIPITPKAIKDKNCGTESEIRDPNCAINSKAGKLKNYCQFFTHCSILGNKPYFPDVDLLSPYYSKACIDFIGDSQNGVTKSVNSGGQSYNGGLLLGQQTNFSAPIVQCLKETMANIFTNTFGHSKCLDGTFGDSNNECFNDNYISFQKGATQIQYKVGNKVKEISFFEKLQKRLKIIINIVLVISITLFGFKLLSGNIDLENRKDFLIYLIKIAIVVYFVNGNAWKTVFFDGIYNGSNEISRIFFKLQTNNERDSCNFGYQYRLGGKDAVKTTGGAITTPAVLPGTLILSSAIYPPGKEYLMIWDTLDCKIMKYMNYKPGSNSTVVFSLIVAAFFTGGIGVVVSFSVLIIAFTLISATIRAMHIFISSAFAIIIYVFISPIIIPLVLFEKTKSIFDAWLTHLMSFSLSPIVLFAYLSIFITLSEQIIFGPSGTEAESCRAYCIKNSNLHIEYDTKKCSQVGYSDLVNPLDTNVSCLLNMGEFGEKTNTGFEFLGFGFPTIAKILEPGKVQLRVILILKTALFLYVLAQFMDEIPEVISKLTGENIDVKGGASGFAMLKQLTSAVRAVQKRGARIGKGRAISKLSSMKERNTKSNDGGGEGGDSNGGDSAKQQEK